jgi:hypothetical protein
MFSFFKTPAASVTTPSAGKVAIFVDSTTGDPMYKDELGVVHTMSGSGANPQFDEDPATTTGLTWGFIAGMIRSGTSVISVAAGTITLAASTTNYVEVDGTGVVSSNVTAFTVGSIPLRTIITGATAIATSTDERAWLVVTGVGGSGSGTVTSVALVMPAAFAVSGTPITTAGTLTVTEAVQLPNLVKAGPASGSTSVVPAYRALVALDIPALAYASSAQGALADSAVQAVIAGTNISVDITNPQQPVVSAAGGLTDPTTTLGDLIARGSTALAALGVGADGQILTADSTAALGIAWAAAASGFANPMTTLGDSIAATAGGTPTRFPVGADGQVLWADSTAALGMSWAVPPQGIGNFGLDSSGTVFPTISMSAGLVMYKKGGTAKTALVTAATFTIAASSTAYLWVYYDGVGFSWFQSISGLSPGPEYILIEKVTSGTTYFASFTNYLTRAIDIGGLRENKMSTKGDIDTYDGTGNVVLGAGATGHVLTVDPSASDGIAWNAPSVVVVDSTATAYTLGIADGGHDLRFNNSVAIALSIPLNTSIPFPVGTWLLFSQAGAGAVTVTGVSGVTLLSPNGAATTAIGDLRGLEQVAIDAWRVI